MKSPFTTCRECHTPDPTARWRESAHLILCAPCDIDRKRAEEAIADAQAAELVHFSPAALAAMARS